MAWIIKNGKWPCVIGVFSSSAVAETHLSTLLPDVQAVSVIASRDDLDLPCFALEKEHIFAFLSEAEIAREVAETPNSQDEAGESTVYRFSGEFIPIRPGRDEMGRLPHWHVGQAEAALVKNRGLAALWHEVE